MSPFRGARWGVPGLALALLAGCGGAAPGGASAGAGPSPRPTSPEAFEALFLARADSALTRYEPADVPFIQGMIAHHAQAIAMAEAAPERATNPSIRTLAARIGRSQADEIELMERWLEDRGEPPGGDHAHHPGMLTPEQMDQLLGSRGAEFDRTFLTLMIQHHEGAVRMVADLLEQGGAARDDTVFRLASDIQSDQTIEIARMRRMLAELPTAGR